MEDHLVFTSKYNGAILSRYNSQENIGLCLFEITDSIKEEIRIMMDIAIIVGSEYINNFCCIESRIIDDFKCVLFVPTLAPDYLSLDKEFLDSFINNVNIWAVSGFKPEQYNKELVVAVEAVYLRVSRDYFQIQFVVFESKTVMGQVFSASICHSAIGL